MEQKINNVEITNMEAVAKEFEDSELEECAVAEESETTQILTYNPIVYIPELKISAARAIFLQRDNESEEFEADWDGTALFSNDEFGFHYEIMEQDDLLLTLHNRYRIGMDELLSMKAIIFDGVEDCIKTNIVSEEIETKIAC